MNQRLADLVPEFVRTYDAESKDRIWQQHQRKFRGFWQDSVLEGRAQIPDEACDEIIRILDTKGKGNRKGSEAVANVMMPQNAWRRLFNALQSDKKLSHLVQSVFESKEERAKRIDELYRINVDNKNRLTGSSGNVLNALLAAYDPLNNLAVVSLKDRKAQLSALQIDGSISWESASVGEKLSASNSLLLQKSRSLGLSGSARTISCFWYWPKTKEVWRGEAPTGLSERNATSVDREESTTDKASDPNPAELRESFQIQARLAQIGSEMGYQIWLPRSDRARVLTQWKAKEGALLESIPGSFEPRMMRAIEQIDVLWFRRQTIVRAFEVEHTTAVYSGLLRMADLLALQPNLQIKLHIIAPLSRREKVLQEIRRPVFDNLEAGPLAKTCTYISYDEIEALADDKKLGRLKDAVLEDFEESALDGEA